MLQRLRAARKAQDGFTLTEFLIVIVVLGVLAGIVVVVVSGINERGVKSACQADTRTVITAVEAYHAQTGGYPAGTEEERWTKLEGAQLLRDRPNSTEYSISVGDGDGEVTGTITDSGADCSA